MTENLENSLRLSMEWLLKSRHKKGGSSAEFRLYGGWNNPYPETTGYIIPTLINYHNHSHHEIYLNNAYNFGEWLLDIQGREGYWLGGLHPSKKKSPSVFNTGQILFGMVALYNKDQDEKWRKSALKAAGWLAENVNNKGEWEVGHYNNFNPTYYTRVAWPMLLAAKTFGETFIEQKAIKVLDYLVQRKTDLGSFQGWGFERNKPAFTHTMAYTVRGFLEASILINDWQRYGTKIEPALNKFYKIAELQNGRLAGEYDLAWKPTTSYSCLTGNVQTALCLMRWHEHNNDLRLLNSASKLVDYVCGCQIKKSVIPDLNGAISGSKPVFGKYMRFRYPNWAAKFHADALMLLIELLNKEKQLWHIEAS